MGNRIGIKTPKKSKPRFLNTILMTSLVLFVLGISGMAYLHFNAFASLVKENIQVSVYFGLSKSELEIKQVQKRLETESFIKSCKYISADEALHEYIKKYNEDPEQFLDFNPLPASLDLFLDATYVNPDSLAVIELLLIDKYHFNQSEIKTDRKLVYSVDHDFRQAGLLIAAIVIILLVLVVLMMDSSIRLAMYSNRFLLRNMLLVGAKRSFIIKPYTTRALLNGLMSGILANFAIIGLLYAARNYFPDLSLLEDMITWAVLFLLIIGLGMFISWISTYRAVNRYLHMKLDELY